VGALAMPLTGEHVQRALGGMCSHENLIACMEHSRTLSCKVSTDAFLFKATTGN
jgi:hypothetical protein